MMNNSPSSAALCRPSDLLPSPYVLVYPCVLINYSVIIILLAVHLCIRSFLGKMRLLIVT